METGIMSAEIFRKGVENARKEAKEELVKSQLEWIEQAIHRMYEYAVSHTLYSQEGEEIIIRFSLEEYAMTDEVAMILREAGWKIIEEADPHKGENKKIYFGYAIKG